MTVEQPAHPDAADPAERIRQLEAALETRGVIARAQGILMERYGLEQEQAISALR